MGTNSNLETLISNNSIQLSRGIVMGYIIVSILAVAFLIAFILMFGVNKYRYSLYGLISVVVINIGYHIISVSKTLEWALFGNRLSYIGSVVLLTAVLFAVINLCGIKVKKYVFTLISVVDLLVILLACSGGTSITLYYSAVELFTDNGCSVLVKEYGSLHDVFLIHVLFKFVTILYYVYKAFVKERIKDKTNPILFAITVFINVFVWTFERFSSNNFEFLSISYVISEALLLVMYKNREVYDNLQSQITSNSKPTKSNEEVITLWKEKYDLTSREGEILELLLNNLRRVEIAQALSITEHTVKKHTGHIYEKIMVTSRNELLFKFNEEITGE